MDYSGKSQHYEIAIPTKLSSSLDLANECCVSYSARLEVNTPTCIDNPYIDLPIKITTAPEVANPGGFASGLGPDGSEVQYDDNGFIPPPQYGSLMAYNPDSQYQAEATGYDYTAVTDYAAKQGPSAPPPPPPPPAPVVSAPWRAILSPDGDYYFHNTETDATTWDKPN